MYTQNPNLCMYCEDPARIINKIQKPYWPFEIEGYQSYCYECYQEVVKGQTPMVTDPTLSSRRGSGMQKRKKYMD